MSDNHTFLTWEEAVIRLRKHPDYKQLVLDCYYDDPLIKAADRYWKSREWESIKKILAVPLEGVGCALDVGAGRGIASFALAKEGFCVTALEPDPGHVVGCGAIRSLAKDTGLPIEVVENVSEKLPFADNAFHIVFVRAALHHMMHLNDACQEFFRVLKPGGRLVAVREHVISKQKDLEDFLSRHPLHKFYGGENACLLSTYVLALKQSGFHNVQVISPWQSPVNYAPHSLKSLKRQLSEKAGLGIPIFNNMIDSLLALPRVWAFAVPVLQRLDNRPGRLYSFVAKKG